MVISNIGSKHRNSGKSMTPGYLCTHQTRPRFSCSRRSFLVSLYLKNKKKIYRHSSEPRIAALHKNQLSEPKPETRTYRPIGTRSSTMRRNSTADVVAVVQCTSFRVAHNGSASGSHEFLPLRTPCVGRCLTLEAATFHGGCKALRSRVEITD